MTRPTPRIGVLALALVAALGLARAADASEQGGPRAMPLNGEDVAALRVDTATRDLSWAAVPPPSVEWEEGGGQQRWPVELPGGAQLWPMPRPMIAPVAEGWGPSDYSPVSDRAYYDAPYYLRQQARFGVALRLQR